MFKSINCRRFNSISIAVVQALESLSIEVIQHSKYCDDAFFTSKKHLKIMILTIY
jgi:hypothetical protein